LGDRERNWEMSEWSKAVDVVGDEPQDFGFFHRGGTTRNFPLKESLRVGEH
jgi:hypothetical protein